MKHKKILLGITGGIAAYKCLDLIRRLKELDAIVKVILTSNATSFITPLSLQAISGNKIYSNSNTTNMDHIELARWPDLILIAPASANFIAKLAHGLADDLLSTTCLATTKQITIAPAMNQQMWQNIATQNNINILKQRELLIWGPNNGHQACGETGPGRLLEPLEIIENLNNVFNNYFSSKIYPEPEPYLALNNKTILITAGPTQEAIDPVRFISNHSSGKMGYALAEQATILGAKVILISGPTVLPTPKNVQRINIITSKEMQQAVMQNISTTDIFIGCAAVTDYRPVTIANQKIKKNNADLILNLEKTPDILDQVAKLAKRPITIGFAAETENLLSNAKKKLKQKNLDMIIANSVSNGKTFNQDYSEIYLVNNNTSHVKLDLALKIENSKKIMNFIAKNLIR